MTDYLSEETLFFKPARKTYRWLAAFIDYILVFACFTGCLMIGGTRYTNGDGRVGYSANGLPAFLAMASWWLILPTLEGLTGQALGKAIFNIKTTKADGSKASMGQCIARHLFDFVDYLPFLGIIGLVVASNSELGQRVGDLVAKTKVVPSK